MRSCTLPPSELPRRLAEFRATLLGATRTGPTSARLRFAAPLSVVRDLTAREKQCCAFFDFTVTPDGDAVMVDVAVPQAYATVLDTLLARLR